MTVDRLLQIFTGLRTVEGDTPILRDVVAAREQLRGARERFLPDFILRWSDAYPATRVRSPELGVIEAMPETCRTGEHRPEGFALVLGAALRTGSLPPITHNQDFPAVIRHLLGVRST